MKATKKLASLLSVAAIATAMVVPTASAAVKGKLTFTHGVRPADKVTFARTTSTAVEKSMDFTGLVKITAGEAPAGTYVLSSAPYYNTSGYQRDFYAGKSKGSSSFNYYVDGSLKHTSTAPWNFDFR